MTYRRFLLLSSLLLNGCGRAPSIDVLGSFFPVWMLCLTVALVLAFVLRAVLARIDVEPHVGPLALFYPSVVICFGCLTWLIFFR
jgi:hypothetical protein